MSAERFEPIPTCEIPPPILEREGERTSEGEALPRILLQAAGSSLHGRRLLLLASLFSFIALIQVMILLRMPPSGTLVIYEEMPRMRLMEERP